MNRQKKTEPIAIFIVLFCTILGAIAQILLKMGSNYLVQSGFSNILHNYWLLCGYTCYALSALLLIIALKKGELSVLYPIIATSYVWVIFLSPLFFSTDSVNSLKIAGVLSIIAGVSIIGLGANK